MSPILNKFNKKEPVEFVAAKIGTEVHNRLSSSLATVSLSAMPKKIKLLAFKEEQRLEVYVKSDSGFEYFKEYKLLPQVDI